MSDYIEVLDETDPGSNLVGDTLIHTDMSKLSRKTGRPMTLVKMCCKVVTVPNIPDNECGVAELF